MDKQIAPCRPTFDRVFRGVVWDNGDVDLWATEDYSGVRVAGRPWFAAPGRDALRNGGLPKYPGVYVVIGDGDVVYVGASGTSIANRILNGHKLRVTDDLYVFKGERFQYITVKFSVGGPHGSWWERERRLIRRLRPFLNIRDNPEFHTVYGRGL